jgi:hypothetical protein
LDLGYKYRRNWPQKVAQNELSAILFYSSSQRSEKPAIGAFRGAPSSRQGTTFSRAETLPIERKNGDEIPAQEQEFIPMVLDVQFAARLEAVP